MMSDDRRRRLSGANWIAIGCDLPGKPEVAIIASRTNRPRDEILGLLIRFWIWVQFHSENGDLPRLTLEMAAELAAVPPWFLRALVECGWLTIPEEGGLRVPNFMRWFGGGAKRRLLDNERKLAGRKVGHPGVGTFFTESTESHLKVVRKMSASKADKLRTDCAQRREEEKIPPPPTPSSASGGGGGDGDGGGGDGDAALGEPAGGDPWADLADQLAALGVACASQSLARAREAGADPRHVQAVIAAGKASQASPGAIAWRVSVARPSLPPDQGWPPPASASNGRPAKPPPKVDGWPTDRQEAIWATARALAEHCAISSPRDAAVVLMVSAALDGKLAGAKQRLLGLSAERARRGTALAVEALLDLAGVEASCLGLSLTPLLVRPPPDMVQRLVACAR